jgi:hypothetical protein
MYKKERLAAKVAAVAIAALGGGLAAATPASAVGPGLFVIPPGGTAAFTGAGFGACNNLTWGYQLSFGAPQDQFTKPGGCFSLPAPNATIGPAPTPRVLRVYLRDNTCGATYYADGTSEGTITPFVDHAIVTPTGLSAWNLRFADAGGFCELKNVPLTTFLGSNFTVNLTITLPPGCDTDDPSLGNDECEQQGQD